MGSVSELPLATTFSTDQALYAQQGDAGAVTNSMLYNLTPMDNRLYSRPAFQEQLTEDLDPAERILQSALENNFLIVTTTKRIILFNMLTASKTAESIFPITPEVKVSGTHYLNSYCIATQKNGFYVISTTKGSNATVTHTASVTAPVPYTNSKVTGANVISSYGNYLLIGSLYIQGTNIDVHEESYILYSKLSQTAIQNPTLPVVINDSTFEKQYPLILAAAGELVELAWFSNQIIASYSSGESFTPQLIPSIIAPFLVRRISTNLGAISENCTVVMEDLAFTLANGSVASISQAGSVDRLGENIRSFIINRNSIPISSSVNSRMQSILWVISSKLCTRSTNQLLVMNYMTYQFSTWGIADPYTIVSITKALERNRNYILITSPDKLHICLTIPDDGVDILDSTSIPINHLLFSPSVLPAERKSLQLANLDPIRVVLTASCPIPLTIYAAKYGYSATEKNPDNWKQLASPTQLELRNPAAVACNSYSCAFADSQSSTGTFISLDIVSTKRFSLEYATVESSIVKG